MFMFRELHGMTQSPLDKRKKICVILGACQNLGGYRDSFLTSRHSVCL